MWYLLILIPIIIAGIFVTKNKFISEPAKTEVQKKETPVIIAEPKEDKTILSDSIQNDSIRKVDIDTTKIKETTAKISQEINTELPIYYLVGGSFKAEENANKYLEQLKSEGYEPFHLGKRGSFYIIGIGKYNVGSEAVKAKKDYLAKNPGSEIWIKKE